MTLPAQAEAPRLSELEEVIEGGLKTFIEVGEALLEIREARLYQSDHATFDDYCRARWDFSARRARQLITASEIGTTVPVENEAQARELVPLRSQPREMAAAQAEASEEARQEDRSVSARDIKAAVAKRKPPTPPKAQPADRQRGTPSTPMPSPHRDERVEAACRIVRDLGPDIDVDAAPERWLLQLLSTREVTDELIAKARSACGEEISKRDLKDTAALADRLGIRLR